MKNILMSTGLNWLEYDFGSTISVNETHLFKISVEDHFQRIRKQINDVLSDFELEKAGRIFNIKDKERYLTSKFYLRTLLSYFINVPAQQVDFITHDYKKPTVQGIEFNISHTGNYILIIISPEIVGVDVEYIDESFEFEPILEITFSKEEIEFIGNPEVDAAKFYALWTRKEAILKAGGEGASNNLHLINCLDDTVSRKSTAYQLHSFLIDEDYIASTAVTLKPLKFNYWNLR